jgi:hypothetical protein
MDVELGALSAEYPLPHGWSQPVVMADTIAIGDVRVERTGITAQSRSGREVTGSAATVGTSPLARAWFELLERAAVIDAAVDDSDDATPRRRASRSNGVAIQRSWQAACRAACHELVERDRVLRSWLGELALEEVEVAGLQRRFPTHEWRASLIAPGSDDIEVAIVVGFPRSTEHPLTRGFAARTSAAAAIEAASHEAIQCLAFLWGEAVPDAAPPLAPTAMFHLDHYLYPPHHDTLRGWLDGAHLRHDVRTTRPGARAATVTFEDLAPSDWRSPLAVARATSPDALDLVFGEPPAIWAESLPPALHVHPIP